MEAIRSKKRIARSPLGDWLELPPILQVRRTKITRRFVAELRAMLAGKRDLLTFIYPCHSPTQQRWFCLIGLPLSLNVALLHVNLTAMLPRPIGMTRLKEVNEQTGPGIDLAGIGGVLERSVEEPLSSQLKTMFTGRARRKKNAARKEADGMKFADVRLSKRQRQVLHLLGEGKTIKEIAMTLFLSPNTVKLHVSAILERLNLRTRTQAALRSSTLFQDSNTELKARVASGR